MKKLFLTTLTSLFMLAAITGCSSTQQASSSKDMPVVKLGLLPITDNLPFWVAEQKGYFKEEGINVEIYNFKSAANRDSALTAGQVDGVLGDIISVTQLNDSGTPVDIVSTGQGVTAREGRFAILSSPQSNIDEISELKNVEIGCSLKTIMEYIIDTSLSSRGFSDEEINKVQISRIPIRLESLLNGSLKAAILPDPLAALAEVKGAHLLFEDTGKNISQTVIYFRKDFLNEQQDAARAVMKAYSRAVEDIQGNPGEFNSILVEKAHMPEIVLQNKNHGMELVFSRPELPTEKQVNRVLNWMRSNDLLEKDLLYEDLINREVINNNL
ncbi:MAG: ABC transporter substrate-binding protein [Clostridiales bacterium]|nr:ABC transporter substrate-binding protein [Clostridiales bacterium]MCF8023488.1 ABC transporter substrate-binding protein [Clostridiales bacterium]